jgi:hypothetical protein
LPLSQPETPVSGRIAQHKVDRQSERRRPGEHFHGQKSTGGIKASPLRHWETCYPQFNSPCPSSAFACVRALFIQLQMPSGTLFATLFAAAISGIKP